MYFLKLVNNFVNKINISLPAFDDDKFDHDSIHNHSGDNNEQEEKEENLDKEEYKKIRKIKFRYLLTKKICH